MVIHGGHVQSGEDVVDVLVKVGCVPESTGDGSTMGRVSSSTRSRHCEKRKKVVLVSRWEFAGSSSITACCLYAD